MKQRKFFRNFFLLGIAIVLFGVSSCNIPESTIDNRAKPVQITRVTIKGQEFDVSVKQDITLPSGVENFTVADVTVVKGKVEGKGAEVVLPLDKIEPETVTATEQGTPFMLYTKATDECKFASIALKAIKTTAQQAVTFNVNFNVMPSDVATLTATVGGNTINSGDPVAKDATVTFALAITKPNFKVKDWTGSADLTLTPDKMGATLVVKENTTISVTLEPVTFNVNFSVMPSDAATLTATVGGNTINSGDPVAKDATVTFALAITKPNFKVKDWAGSADLTLNPDKMGATLVVKENTTISVTLEEEGTPPKDVTVTFEVESGDDSQPHGKIAVFKDLDALTSGAKVKVGDTLKALALPESSYKVESWKINGVVKENETGKFFSVSVLDEHVASGLKITVKYKK